MRAQKAVGQRLVFTQQTQQQVLRLYIRRAELAGLVSCKEDYAPGFLGVPREHIPLTQMLPVTSAGNISLSFSRDPATSPERSLSVLPAPSVTRGSAAAPDKPAICLTADKTQKLSLALPLIQRS